MHLAICDDDESFRNELRNTLQEHVSLFKYVKIDIFSKGEEFLECNMINNYDAVFLDIYLNGESGFDIAKQMNNQHMDTRIIFITSNNCLVYDSFEYQPFYFIRKDNYKEIIGSVIEKLNNVLKMNKVFELENRQGCEIIRLSQIIYIESDKHEIVVHTRKYDCNTRRKISDVEIQLSQYDFIRIHKSYLVNMQYIRKIDMSFDEITLMNGIRLEMSRRVKQNVLESYHKYQRRMRNI